MGRMSAGSGLFAVALFLVARTVMAASGDATDVQAATTVPKVRSHVHVSAKHVLRHHVVFTRSNLHSAVLHVRRTYAVGHRGSYTTLQGLHAATLGGALALQSSVALVMDATTSDVLFSKRSDVALPIASITKLMTSLVVLEAHQPMDEPIEITTDDIDTVKHSTSRLAVGTVLSRRDLLHLALMASENRAAHALCRNYPGGLSACLAAMNNKALQLGMISTHFNDPTGLSYQNVASAEDLAKLLKAASENATIREFSTDSGFTVPVGRRMVAFRNTDALISNPRWDIVLQKTGYIVEAGRCLVMKAKIEGKAILIVLLDSVGKYTRFGDASRIKKWMEENPGVFTTATPVVPPETPSVEHVTS